MVEVMTLKGMGGVATISHCKEGPVKSKAGCMSIVPALWRELGRKCEGEHHRCFFSDRNLQPPRGIPDACASEP